MATSASRLLGLPCRPRFRLVMPNAGPRAYMATSSRPQPSCRRVPPSRLHNNSAPARCLSSSSSPPGHKYVYNVAASYIAKGLPYDPSTHIFHFNPYNRVQPPKPGRAKSARPESGQDAFFVSRLGSQPGSIALGVADGVGGWMDSGVDPADFSHAFCDYMAAVAHGYRAPAPAAAGTRKVELTARELMKNGYEAVCHDPAIEAGGSTAVVGLLGEDGTLEVANLGDSGYIVLRLNGVHAHSEPQTHAFNTPFQLSVVPPKMLMRAAKFGGAQLMDQPRDAEVTRVALRHGDVVVFASDGLWDNLFNQDILRIVSRTMAKVGAWASTDAGVQVVSDLSPYTHPRDLPADEEGAAQVGKARPSPSSIITLQSLIAMEIVGAAKAASLNGKLDGPFAKEVKKHFPDERWHGGKEDDICAIVVLVAEEPAQPGPVKAKL